MKTLFVLIGIFAINCTSNNSVQEKGQNSKEEELNDHKVENICQRCDSLILIYKNWLELDGEKHEKEIVSTINCAVERKCYDLYAIYGENLIFGFKHDRDVELGLKLLEEAYRNGNNTAGFVLAKYYLSEQKYNNAIKILNNLSERDYDPAIFELSYIFLKNRSFYLGKKLESSEYLTQVDKGISLLKRSASKGNIYAQIELGLIYKNGSYEVPKDYIKGDSLLEEALLNPKADSIPGIRDDIRYYLYGEY